MLSPAERAAATRASFERKVQLLESWAQDGVPDRQPWPRTVADLARWDDPVLGVARWTSPNLTSPCGKHADLRARFDKALAKLGDTTERQKGIARLRAENKMLAARNRALAEQVVELIQRHMRLANLLQQQATLLEQAGLGPAAGKIRQIAQHKGGAWASREDDT